MYSVRQGGYLRLDLPVVVTDVSVHNVPVCKIICVFPSACCNSQVGVGVSSSLAHYILLPVPFICMHVGGYGLSVLALGLSKASCTELPAIYQGCMPALVRLGLWWVYAASSMGSA